MTTQQIGLALELINGHGMSYEETSDLTNIDMKTLRRVNEHVMTFINMRWSFENYRELVVKQSKINEETE